MKRFRNFYDTKQNFRICLFEGEEHKWPIIDGWTQRISSIGLNGNDGEKDYEIEYANDKKDFIVNFSIKQDKYFNDNFEGKWYIRAWGKKEEGIVNSLKKIKSVLKKSVIFYENSKIFAMKKIPNIPEWKKIVNDYEIVYSKKQNDRTVILRIMNIHGFIKNLFIGHKVGVYDDQYKNRYAETEFYIDSRRSDLKSKISYLDNKFFKKE